jgi:Leucine-rich repeat (LRR) protein
VEDLTLYDSLAEALKTPARIQRLTLNGQELIMVPGGLFRLTNLIELDLSYNKLARLTKFRRLSATGNMLTAVPPQIGALAHLEDLNLTDNEITALPPQIGRLTRLLTLYLSGNRLSTLPAEIGNLSRLYTLDLLRNPIRTLPATMTRLKNLTEMTIGCRAMSRAEQKRLEARFPHISIAFGP